MTKKRVLVLGVIAALAVAGVAIAYFTSTGTGTGSASVGKASAYTVTVSSDTSNGLYPGAGEETLTYKVKNNSAGPQNLESTSASVASSGGNITEGGTPVAGCKASWFKAVNHPPALPKDLASNGEAEGTVTVTMEDAAENQNACQEKKPDITVNAA
jgi:hypothetical protein